MAEPEYLITWQGGVKEFKPVEYRLDEETTGPWWWRSTRFWITTEFCRVGPFRSRDEAAPFLAMARRI